MRKGRVLDSVSVFALVAFDYAFIHHTDAGVIDYCLSYDRAVTSHYHTWFIEPCLELCPHNIVSLLPMCKTN